MSTPNRKKGQQIDDMDGVVRQVVDDLVPLIEQLRGLQARARAHGIFVDDRELLVCPGCGLAEDVLADGRLATFHDLDEPDTERRFIEPHVVGAPFICPECGNEARDQERDV